MEALHEVCKANITVKSFGKMVPWIEKNSTKNIGNINGLSDTYSTILNQFLKKKIIDILDKCYLKFGTVNDGTPCFAKAEAVSLRAFTMDEFDICDILISFSLFQGSLNAKKHSHNILSAIIYEGGRDPKYWRPAIQDRDATNIAVINLVKKQPCTIQA